MASSKYSSIVQYGLLFLLLTSTVLSGPVTYAACVAACMGVCETGIAVAAGAATGGVGAIPAAAAGVPECSTICASSCAWALVAPLP